MDNQNIKRYTTGEEIFNSVSHGVSALGQWWDAVLW